MTSRIALTLLLTSAQQVQCPSAPDGVKLVLSEVPVNKRQHWKPGVYDLTFVNGSKVDFAFHATSPVWAVHTVKLLNKSHEEPPLTEEGKKIRDAPRFDYSNRNHDFRHVLHPGESETYQILLEMDKFYSLLPGKYVLSVTYWEHNQDPVIISSNSIPFTESTTNPQP